MAKCSSSAILPCMSSSVMSDVDEYWPLILALRRQPERELAVHGADGIPVHADMAADGIGVAPCPLHGVGKIEAEPAGRCVQRFGGANGQCDRKGLAATADDAILDRDRPVITNRGRTISEIAQQPLARRVDGSGRFRNAQLDGREIRHAVVMAG